MATCLQYDKQVNEWQLTVFVVGDFFRFFGPPFKAHLRFISFDKYYTDHLSTEQPIYSFSWWWEQYIHRLIIAQVWPKITTLTACQILNFQAPLKNSFQIIFFLILLPMIKYYKTSKRTKLYYDLIKVLGIMAVQIWLKMLIFSFFGSYPYFEFLRRLQILNTNILM